MTFWPQVADMVERTEASLGPVDILVNNAGVMYYTMMKNLQEEQWNRQINLNCKVHILFFHSGYVNLTGLHG